jgi:hypothetical protein
MAKMYGVRYMTYIGDDLHIYRITKFKNEDTVVLTDQADGSTVNASDDDLHNKYVCLTPDAFMNIFTTDTADCPDVYVCVNRAGQSEPELVARQVYLNNATQFNPSADNKITVGECINSRCNPSNDPVLTMMEFKKIDKAVQCAIYVDDTLDSILNCIPEKKIEIFDNQLKAIKNELANEMTVGYAESLKEFLNNVYFIIRFKEIFNIGYIDWPIELGKESYDKEGDIILNDKQKARLQDYLRMYITNIKVIKYGNDIDISKTIETSHVMVTDPSENIYIITFAKVGDYPVDQDIAAAFGIM